MKKSVFTKFWALAIVVLSALFVGCNTEEVTFESPEITVSQSVISDAPQGGGIVALTVETNRTWRVVVPEGVDWIIPAPGFANGEGPGTVKLDLLPNESFDREATVKISTSTVYAAVRIVQPGLLTKTDLYSDNFNNGFIFPNDVKSIPVADYTGWNKKGPGSANVTYSATGADVRSTLPASPTTPNNVYFPAAGADFFVNNIGKGTATKLTLNFEIQSYSADYTPDRLKLYYSTADNAANWTEVEAVRANSKEGWQPAKSSFTVDAGASQINLKFSGKDIRVFNLNLWAEGIIDMPDVPVITTNDATEITKTSASVTGKFTYDGAGTIDEVGVAYCKSTDTPQVFTNVAANPKPAPGATFTVALSGLSASTEYLYKSYVKIGAEYYYGQQKSFSTELGGTLLFDETFGTTAPASGTYPTIVAYTGFVTTGAGASSSLITGTTGASAENVSVRTPSVDYESKGYPGASGSSSAFMGGASAVMYAYNVSTGGQSDLKLTFGMTRSTGSGEWLESYLVLSYSTDNITWTPVTYTRGKTGLGWALTTANITLSAPVASVVSFKFAAGDSQIRIDDILVSCTTEGVTPAAGVKMTGATSSNVDITTATVGGTYMTGGGTPSETGVYYRKAADAQLVKAAAVGIASPISVALTGLASETDYVFVPYAVVGGVTYYGPSATFTTKSALPASLITIADLRAKAVGLIDANEKVEGVVISDKDAKNINNMSIVIQDKNTAGSGITIRTKAAHNYAMGDNISIVIDGGTLSLYNGLLQFSVKADDQISKMTTSTITATAQTIAPSALASYESMLVKIENCQITAEDMSKVMGGVNQLITSAGDEFDMNVITGTNAATFATDAIPTGSGSITGIASIYKTDTQIQPRTMADLSLTGTRFMTLGTPAFSATTFKEGAAIVAGKITIPYYDATANGAYTLSVAVSGAGAAGINSVTNLAVNYSQGSGNIEIPISGTPTTAGAVTFTVSGIASLATTTCTGTVIAAGGSADVVIDVDFSDAASYPAGFPTVATKDVATYTFAGYSFTFSGGTAGTGYYKGPTNKYLMIGQTNSFIELPAISGKSLKKVVLTSTSGVSGSAKVAIKTADGATVVTGGEEQLIKVPDPFQTTYTLTSTVANTSYRFYVTTGANAQIAKLSLTYAQ